MLKKYIFKSILVKNRGLSRVCLVTMHQHTSLPLAPSCLGDNLRRPETRFDNVWTGASDLPLTEMMNLGSDIRVSQVSLYITE